jgi:hypothetical protein
MRTRRPSLFVPLRGEWFDAIARGDKTDEWRRLGVRFNLDTCSVGRELILSRGYSGARLRVRVVEVSERMSQESPAASGIYGPDVRCVVMRLGHIQSVRRRARSASSITAPQ